MTKRKKRPRPGRLRRWLLRPALWLLALAAVLLAAGVVYVDSASFAERLRREAEARLTAALGRDVQIGGLELDPLPLAATITDVSIAGPAPGAEPFLTLARALVEVDLGAILRRRLDLRHLHLEAPRLRIGFDGEGRADTPRWSPGAERREAEPIEVRFGTLEIDDGEFVLDDDRTPIDLTARELEAVFVGTGDGIDLRGRAGATDLGLVLPPGRPYAGAVELHGVIRAHRFDLLRGELTGPDLVLRADGYWRWQGDRELALELDAVGDFAVLGRLGYLERQLAGPFRFDGELTRKPGVLLVDGGVTAPRATAFDRELRDLAARLNVDTNALSLRIDRAHHGGGVVTGSVDLGLAVEPGRVDLELELDRVRLGRLLADLGIPIVGLSGGVSGVFNYQFDSATPDRGNGWADLVVADARAPAARDVAVSGTIPLVIGRGVVRSDALRLTAADFRLTAGGAYDLKRATGAYDFELDADGLGQVMRLVPGAAAVGAAAAWRPTAGRGRATGRLELGRAGAALRLQLDLTDVEAPGIDADSVTGVVALDGGGVRELRLEAMRPDAALIVSGTLPFAEPPPGVEAPIFALALDSAAWPLAQARPWLPFELPVEGPYTGVVELGGGAASAGEGLAGRIVGRLAPVSWGERAVDSLTVEADFDPVRLSIAAAELAAAGGAVSASGTILWDDLGLDLAIESTPLAVADLLGVESGKGALDGLAGRLGGRVGGRIDEPDLRLRLEWIVPAGAVAASGDEAIDIEWRAGRLSAAGPLPGIGVIDGGGELTPEKVDLEWVLSDGRLEALGELAAPGVGLQGEYHGRVRVTGRYDEEVDLAAAVVLDHLTVRLPGEPEALPALENLEPVVLDLDTGGLYLRSLYLGDAAGKSEVFVGGRVTAAGGLDLVLQTTVASDWLAPLVDRLWPGARWSGGAFDAIATVEGDVAAPRINGVGEVRGARLVAEGLPSAIEDLSGTALFYRDQVVLEAVRARFAGGSVQAGGVVPLRGDGVAFRFQAVGKRLSYRSPDGWAARGDGELVLAATPDGQQLSGALVLDEVVYVKNVKLGLEQLLQGLFGSERLEVRPAEGWRASTALNLRIEGNRALRVRNNLADLRGSADLVLRGTLARPVVFGSVEVEPGGRLEYGGVDYRVERGELAFTNPYRIEPAIDLAASTELREYDVTLLLTGTLDRLELDFTSNPPLADLDVLGLLTGSPGASVDAAGEPTGEGVSAQSFLYGQATTLIAQRFNRLFGLDKFRIDPLTGAAGGVSSARVTVGKQLSRNLLVTYSYDPSSTEEQVLELNWNVTRGLVLVMTQNGDGTYAVDALWEKAF